MHAEIYWTNNDLIVRLPKRCRELESSLKYTKKELVFSPAQRKRITKKTTKHIFNIIPSLQDNMVTYQTFQGMFDTVVDIVRKSYPDAKVIDKRLAFPLPLYDRLGGLRFNQEEVLRKGLDKNRSGLFKCPTRYGKTRLITNTINVYPNLPTVVLAPGIDLLPQTMDTIKQCCPGREVKGLFTGSKDRYPSEDITVCSLDSMHKLDFENTKLVLVDEPHSAVTESRAPYFPRFSNARILGFGATTDGRWGGEDILITGLMGPVLSQTTYTECVKLGALCPIHVYMIKVSFTPKNYVRRDLAYKYLVQQNAAFNALVGHICNNIIPKDFQTLVFIENSSQAEVLSQQVNDSIIAMDKLMKNKKERQELFAKMKANEIKRCICSNIYSTGVTIDELRCEINCCGGGAGIMATQKPGRLAEVKPNKPEGIMIDFLFMPSAHCNPASGDAMIMRDSYLRLNAYRELGYTVDILENIEQLKI